MYKKESVNNRKRQVTENIVTFFIDVVTLCEYYCTKTRAFKIECLGPQV